MSDTSDTHLAPFQLDALLAMQFSSLEKTGSAKRGTFLFGRGDSPKGVFLLLSGKVALSAGDPATQLRRSCLPGCLLGLPATIRNRPYSLTAECLEDCQYVRFSHDALMNLLRSNPEFCMRVVEVLANEVGDLRGRIPEQASGFARFKEQLSQFGYGVEQH